MQNTYYAVIFTSILSEQHQGYNEMADKMEQLARQQPGFLGMDSARGETGITISYWKDLNDITSWKKNLDHISAQNLGKRNGINATREICKVEKIFL
jgi:Uncharacterized enzyme involved in biosynthesis of extracellular polysaccharides